MTATPDTMAQSGPPEKLGRYRLVRCISTGGMSRVYEARRESLAGVEPKVALKVILPEHANDEKFQKLFVNEARVGSQLQHQNLVQIQDFDRQEDCFYLVMEYVEGLTLRRTISHCKRNGVHVPLAVIAELGRQICEGLHYAHTARREDGVPLNLVHRDIKPSNLILNPQGVVKILDFGISKALTAAESRGTVKGTWGYMSPEQSQGGDVGPAADQYGVAAVLYELAMLRPLFPEKKPRELRALMAQDEAVRRASRISGPHGPLVPILIRALQRDPFGRWPDSMLMAQALARLAPDQVVARQQLLNFQSTILTLDRLRKSGRKGGPAAVQAAAVDLQANERPSDFISQISQVSDVSHPSDISYGHGSVNRSLPSAPTLPPPAPNLAGSVSPAASAQSLPTGVPVTVGDHYRPQIAPPPPPLEVPPLPPPSPQGDNSTMTLFISGVAMCIFAFVGYKLWMGQNAGSTASVRPDPVGIVEPVDAGTVKDPAAAGGAEEGPATTGGAQQGSTVEGSAEGSAEGSTDGGATDGGATDGGATDGGATDGGPTDGGPTDGGSTGAGAHEGGSEAGATGTSAKGGGEGSGQPREEPDSPRLGSNPVQRDPPREDVRPTKQETPPTESSGGGSSEGGVGTVTISSLPKSTVYIDGQMVGKTPIYRHEVSAAVHSVQLVTEDNAQRRSFSVQVEAGQDTKRIYDFTSGTFR